MKSIKQAFSDYVAGDPDIEKTGWFRFLVGVIWLYLTLAPRMLLDSLLHAYDYRKYLKPQMMDAHRLADERFGKTDPEKARLAFVRVSTMLGSSAQDIGRFCKTDDLTAIADCNDRAIKLSDSDPAFKSAVDTIAGNADHAPEEPLF